jgi:CDP-glucose 4,6-dehydratase
LGKRTGALEDLVMPQDLGAFYAGKKVFLTGHTGFKGGWLAIWLKQLGADVTGFSLAPETSPNLFTLASVDEGMRSILGDIRDAAALEGAMAGSQPEIVFHLAAQPLVRRSYRDPVETYSTNVMGTLHLLQAARAAGSVRAVVVVTSDKCYENLERMWGYRESDALGGYDPYSSSKACAEILTSAFRRSYCGDSDLLIATARAGNVIGGGDWAEDRLVPDVVRAISSVQPVVLHNPHAVRPWQHVLEPLHGYLLLGRHLFSGDPCWAEAWNFGPALGTEARVEDLARLLIRHWGAGRLVLDPDPAGPHEAGQLRLDSTKSILRIPWKPLLNLSDAVAWTVQAYQGLLDSRRNAASTIEKQICDYMAAARNDSNT